MQQKVLQMANSMQTQISPEIIAKYSDFISRGLMSVDDLRQLGMGRDEINAIVSQSTPGEKKPTSFQNVTIKDDNGITILAAFDPSTGKYTVN